MTNAVQSSLEEVMILPLEITMEYPWVTNEEQEVRRLHYDPFLELVNLVLFLSDLVVMAVVEYN